MTFKIIIGLGGKCHVLGYVLLILAVEESYDYIILK